MNLRDESKVEKDFEEITINDIYYASHSLFLGNAMKRKNKHILI
jgi:hypothetical protein